MTISGHIEFEAHVTEERPSLYLRWNGSTLEQQWQVLTISGGYPVGSRSEWRPVPTAEQEPST